MRFRRSLALIICFSSLLLACSSRKPLYGAYVPKYPDTLDRQLFFYKETNCVLTRHTETNYTVFKSEQTERTGCKFQVSGDTITLVDRESGGTLWFGTLSEDGREIVESMAPRNAYVFDESAHLGDDLTKGLENKK